MTVTNEGLRIELTESASGVFFESGSDRMSADGIDLVKLLGQELGKLRNTLAIEGHTDSNLIHRALFIRTGSCLRIGPTVRGD